MLACAQSMASLRFKALLILHRTKTYIPGALRGHALQQHILHPSIWAPSDRCKGCAYLLHNRKPSPDVRPAELLGFKHTSTGVPASAHNPDNGRACFCLKNHEPGTNPHACRSPVCCATSTCSLCPYPMLRPSRTSLSQTTTYLIATGNSPCTFQCASAAACQRRPCLPGTSTLRPAASHNGGPPPK
jgi:hypothetical protein